MSVNKVSKNIIKFQAGCPDATQNIAINLENRQNAIDVANYGPLTDELAFTNVIAFWFNLNTPFPPPCSSNL